MGRVLRPSVRAIVVPLAVGVIVAAGLVSAAALTAAATAPPVDHFLCYSAKAVPTAAGPSFKVPAGVRLVNQFAPNGIVPRATAVDLHCNPAQKTVGAKVFKITNPAGHLLCWKIVAPTQPARTVQVTNQFGSAKLKTGAATQLCLPTWKSLTGPPQTPTPAPPRLSHFTCYAVSYIPGAGTFKPPAVVQVKDQFSAKPVSTKVGNPVLLCLPTTKILPTGKSFAPANTAAHLLCFTVGTTPVKSPVFDKNQFGTGSVQIQRTNFLCLPSAKKVVASG
jgi:hypothetical protein